MGYPREASWPKESFVSRDQLTFGIRSIIVLLVKLREEGLFVGTL